MKPRLHPCIVVAALAVSPWPSSAVKAQVAVFSHGVVEGGQVLTDRSAIGTTPGETIHHPLASSLLTVVIQPGDSDLFVFEFDAQCTVVGGPFDYLSVQARLDGVVGGVIGGSYFQPQDIPPDLQACSTNGARQTISKSWVIRLSNTTSSPQSHTFSIWVKTVEFAPLNNAHTTLDNRTVRYTRYN